MVEHSLQQPDSFVQALVVERKVPEPDVLLDKAYVFFDLDKAGDRFSQCLHIHYSYGIEHQHIGSDSILFHFLGIFLVLVDMIHPHLSSLHHASARVLPDFSSNPSFLRSRPSKYCRDEIHGALCNKDLLIFHFHQMEQEH